MILPSLGAVVRAAGVAVGLAVGLPSRGDKLWPRPRPARDYASAVERAERRQTADDSVVAPGGRAILLAHGHRTPRAVVLLHGFTDSPRQFAAVADSLYAHGDNVWVPRLPRHAERSGDVGTLARLNAAELRDTGDEAVDIAVGLGDSVVVVGLSAGGTIAAWAAQHRSDVTRAVLISPAFEATHVPSMLEWPLIKLAGRAPNYTRRAAGDSERPDWHPGFATHALTEVLRLGVVLRHSADDYPPGAKEIAILLNANDRTIKESPAIALGRRWASHGAAVSLYEFPKELRLPHNVLETSEHGGNVATVTRALLALVEGGRGVY